MGVNVVETEEAAEEGEEPREERSPRARAASWSRSSRGPGQGRDQGADRAHRRPVRMYLRENGLVELLSREGEIAIAKRMKPAVLTPFTTDPKSLRRTPPRY